MPADFLEELSTLASSLAEIDAVWERGVADCGVCWEGCAGDDGVEALEHWRALIHLMVAPSSGRWRKEFCEEHDGLRDEPVQRRHRLRALLEQISHREDLLEEMRRRMRCRRRGIRRSSGVVAKALFRVLRRALVELQLVFAERGECDFAELALLAKDALETEGGVSDLAVALGMELRHLLVDEMQDTSTSQYGLIELLTQGWDGQSQTVFLVGDPKQSIYLFRQARVERFVRTMETERVGRAAGGVLRLTANFRSQRELVDDVQ